MPRVLVGAVVLLVALAGCGRDPKADPSPSPSTTTASPASTSPAPPALPEAAKANTKAGAIAFVKYYIAIFNQAQRSGLTANLSALSTPSCSDCEAAITGLGRIYGAGGHIDGGDLVLGPATAEHNPIEKTWLVLVRVDSGPQTVTTTNDSAPSSLP